MNFFKFFSLAILIFLMFFSSQVYAENDWCEDNFKASIEYLGQDKNLAVNFSNYEPENVSTESFFKTKLKVEATGLESKEEKKDTNVILAIDRSSFLQKGTLDKLTQDTSFFIDLLNNENNKDNKIGLITFNGNVTVHKTGGEFLLSSLDSLKNQIGTLPIGGNSNIGGALLTANDYLKKYGEENKRWFIILITNGYFNSGVHPAEIASSIDSKITVYAIGTNSSADESLLNYITKESGSKEGNSFLSEGNLRPIIKEIADEILQPFSIKNIKAGIDLTNFNNGKFFIENSSPDYSSFDDATLLWKDIAPMKNGDFKEFYITVKNVSAHGLDMPINEGELKLEYDIFKKNENLATCIESINVNIIKISNPFRCSGSLPNEKTITICPETQKNLTIDLIWDLTKECGIEKCTYKCNNLNGYFNYQKQCIHPACNDQVKICGLQPDNLCKAGEVVKNSWHHDETDDLWKWQCAADDEMGKINCESLDYCKRDYYKVNP